MISEILRFGFSACCLFIFYLFFSGVSGGRGCIIKNAWRELFCYSLSIHRLMFVFSSTDFHTSIGLATKEHQRRNSHLDFFFFLELASHRGVMSIALQNHGSAYISGGFFLALHGTVILERRGALIFLYTGAAGGGGGGLWRKWDGFFLLVSNTLYFFFPRVFFYQEYFLFFFYIPAYWWAARA